MAFQKKVNLAQGLGVVGIDTATRAQAERPAEPKAEVGDLLLKSGAWVKADEVTSEHKILLVKAVNV